MNNILKLIVVGLISFLAGKYIFPPKAEVKEVIKYVKVETKVENKNKVIKSTKVKKPDGTVVTETTIVDTGKTNTESNTKIDSTKVSAGSKITVGLLAIKDGGNFSAPATFGATIAVPLIGNLKAQALGTTDKRVGLGIALDF